MTTLFSFLRNLKLFSIVAAPIYIPTNSERGTIVFTWPFINILLYHSEFGIWNQKLKLKNPPKTKKQHIGPQRLMTLKLMEGGEKETSIYFKVVDGLCWEHLQASEFLI